jgi:predicted dehydrogenase
MLRYSGVNLIVIITPHNTHARLARQALKAGCHVVCEKPLAITTAECDGMIETANAQGLVLSTYHNRHWDGCILRAVEQIRKGVIGDVIRIEAHMGGYGQPGDWWRTSRSISGGILYDWGVHLIEYSLQLLDGGLTEVTGFAKTGFWADKTAWKDDTNEDEGFVAARFDSGQWLTLCITNIDSNPKRGQLEITGTRGTYIFDGGTWETITFEGGEKIVRSGKNPDSEGEKFYLNIARHLVDGEELVITPEWSRRPIHILDLGCRSAARGRSYAAKYQ